MADNKWNNFAKNGPKKLEKISQDREMFDTPFYVKISKIARKSKPEIEFCRFNYSFVSETKELFCVN